MEPYGILLFSKLLLFIHIVLYISSHFSRSVQLFATPWTSARQASLSITNSQSLPKLMSIESVMSSNYLIFCCPLLLLPSIFLKIRVFSNESALHIRWQIMELQLKHLYKIQKPRMTKAVRKNSNNITSLN